MIYTLKFADFPYSRVNNYQKKTRSAGPLHLRSWTLTPVAHLQDSEAAPAVVNPWMEGLRCFHGKIIHMGMSENGVYPQV